MAIKLDEKPNTGTLTITIGTVRLKTGDYSVSNNVLTLSPTALELAHISLGDTIGITYTAPVLHSAGEQVYDCTTDASGKTSCYGETYVALGTSSTETDTTWSSTSPIALDTAPVVGSITSTSVGHSSPRPTTRSRPTS